jgi:heptosyltransferase-3
MATGGNTSIERVLVIFPGALGDLVCLLPALAVLARRYPGQSLELMARGELAEFAAGRTPVARGHSIDRREVSLLFSTEADAAQRSAEFFAGFAAIHSFFGHDHPGMREALARACPGPVHFHPFRPEGPGHISAAYLQALGESSSAMDLKHGRHLRLQPDDLKTARAAASGFGIGNRRFVLLMPGSGGRSKNWPVQHYLELRRHLARFVPVVTVLGPAEAHLEASFSGLPLISTPSLGVLAGVARLSAAFVGNDSGVSHLAAAAGARGVVIFGPTDPQRWRPLGRVMVMRRMPLQDLGWREVAAAVELILGSAE